MVQERIQGTEEARVTGGERTTRRCRKWGFVNRKQSVQNRVSEVALNKGGTLASGFRRVYSLAAVIKIKRKGQGEKQENQLVVN